MTSNLPLPPHLEQFVREQLTIGRFQSENDVIRAALLLLEQHSPPRQTSGSPAGERLYAGDASGSGTTAHAAGRRSPRGILADLKSDITFDDIKEARREMWSGFPHDGA